MLGSVVRGVLLVGGVGLIVVGVAALIFWVYGLALYAFIGGAVLLVAVGLERQRYRSESAERGGAAPGPGGGEQTGEVVEPRFRPTSEAFIDPTSGHRMRVLVDPGTGERRYVAEA